MYIDTYRKKTCDVYSHVRLLVIPVIYRGEKGQTVLVNLLSLQFVCLLFYSEEVTHFYYILLYRIRTHGPPEK